MIGRMIGDKQQVAAVAFDLNGRRHAALSQHED
jgi:hypothetical protein